MVKAERFQPERRWQRRAWTLLLAGSLLLFMSAAIPTAGWAGARDQARRMHDRLVGVPPADDVLQEMQDRIQAGQPVQAAYLAMENPLFYTSTLKNFATPWTNEAETIFAPLNDYSATVIGMIRDEVPFDRVLSADMVYIGAPGVVEPAYSHEDNHHYEHLGESGIDLSDPAVLIAVSQSGLPGAQIPSGATAGVLTTRAAGKAFFRAGTNRRMLRSTVLNYLCTDLEGLKDTTRPADRIRQDVSRSPGGDSTVFLNNCSGCHTGMDPLVQAFAYFEYDQDAERVVYTPGQVQAKYLQNAGTFPSGFVTPDDSWTNYWRNGPNASVGWGSGSGEGSGPKSFGQEIAGSRAFAVCQVEKVFSLICLRPVGSQQDRDEVERIANVFETSGRSMKRVFGEVATHCMGD